MKSKRLNLIIAMIMATALCAVPVYAGTYAGDGGATIPMTYTAPATVIEPSDKYTVLLPALVTMEWEEGTVADYRADYEIGIKDRAMVSTDVLEVVPPAAFTMKNSVNTNQVRASVTLGGDSNPKSWKKADLNAPPVGTATTLKTIQDVEGCLPVSGSCAATFPSFETYTGTMEFTYKLTEKD